MAEQQQQGTEYTLQGVMRFLQMEWHNHERARNSWDIERAEMKVKIAKQEGENRNSKRLNETLEKQIKMLERSLKVERSGKGGNAEATTSGAIAEGEVNGAEKGDKGESKRGTKQGHDEPLDTETDADRSKVNTYVHRMNEEMAYLLTNPSQPAPSHANAQAMQQISYDQQQSTDDAYMMQQQQQQQQQQLQRRVPPQQLVSPYLNHPLQPRNETSQPAQQPQHGSSMVRQSFNQSFMQQEPPQQTSNHTQTPDMTQFDEQVEIVTHSFDSYGRPIENRETGPTITVAPHDPDAWDFDDSTISSEAPQDALPPPPQARRPDTDVFPTANPAPPQSPNRSPQSHRRKSSSGGISMLRRRSEGGSGDATNSAARNETAQFKVRFALRGHLDVVRSIIFTGGGSPSEPEICTTGDDGTIKRWYIPASFGAPPPGSTPSNTTTPPSQPPVDLDIQSYFTHRGHDGAVTCLAACPASPSFSTGGRVSGDGWVFSGGQDASIRVWERGRVDCKATLDGHTDAIWALCVLPCTASSIFGPASPASSTASSSSDRILLVSGAADNTLKIWAVSAPPLLATPQPSRRGGARRNSVTSGSAFPSSPQPSTASTTPFHYTLLHSISTHHASPTCIAPLGSLGETFVVSYADAAVLVYDTRTGEEVVGMASSETYDGTPRTGVNSVVVAGTSSQGMDQGGGGGGVGEVMTGLLGGGGGGGLGMGLGMDEEGNGVHGATGDRKSGGVEGVVISGHEDRFVRFYDANSGQCTYSMLAHPSSIASLSLSPDGREMVSAGHDASLRFWSLEMRACVQEVASHRLMRGEGVVCVVWSSDGRWVVGGGGDGVVKVFAR